jgi:hypothetical protein
MIGTPKTSVKATLDAEGSVRAKVVATCGYGSRTATADAEITDKKALKAIGEAMKAAVETVKGLDQQVTADACKALVVATEKGEKI